MEVACTVSDADPRAEVEHHALFEYNVGEVKRRHQVRQGIFDEHSYLARQLSVFYQQAYL
jgi:hypothetical protein